jgi:hypothetical protein
MMVAMQYWRHTSFSCHASELVRQEKKMQMQQQTLLSYESHDQSIGVRFETIEKSL